MLGFRLHSNSPLGMVRLAILHTAFLDLRAAGCPRMAAQVGETSLDRTGPAFLTEH